MNVPDRNDPLGYGIILQELLADPALARFSEGGSATQESYAVAHHLAETLGYCRLFGVDVPVDVDGSLSASIATAACNRLRDQLTNEIESLDDFPATWEQTQSQIELEMLCCDILESRMDAWAVVIAVTEALRVADDESRELISGLELAIRSLLDSVDRFDSSLIRERELLCVATDTNLLDNWRNLVAEEYRLALPWWLDGTLERIADAPLERIDLSNLDMQKINVTDQLELASQPFHRFYIRSRKSAPALAANDRILRPEFDKISWIPSEPEFQCQAVLKVPQTLSASGRTEVRLEFKGAQRHELAGKPVVLGNGRAVIRARSLTRLPGESLIEATFIAEELELPDGSRPLRVDNQIWQEQSTEIGG
jgi:hypothetical protein